MPGSNGQPGQQQVDVCRPVGTAKFYGLLVGMIIIDRPFLGIGLVEHIHFL